MHGMEAQEHSGFKDLHPGCSLSLHPGPAASGPLQQQREATSDNHTVAQLEAVWERLVSRFKTVVVDSLTPP